ncbi:MAG: DUF1570 domain-containing protein [Acidobacteriaceae bacterium]|nr:DUF1570 domain-containing protein [Acidobacteriaceae bacterium]
MRLLFQKVLPYASFDAGQPIVVLALKNRKSFEALEPASYLERGSLTLAGLFQPTEARNYILLRLDAGEGGAGSRPFATIYHEYTHFLLRKSPWIPLWLNEGLAQFYENTDLRFNKVSLGMPDSNQLLFLRSEKLIPVQTLITVNHDSPYYHQEDAASVFYAESWALTHMLEVTDAQNHQSRVMNYAKALLAGKSSTEAAQLAFGDLTTLGKELDSYVARGSYMEFQLNLDQMVNEASFTTQPITTEQADAYRADVLAHDNRSDEAMALDRQILSVDEKNALAHETLGLIALHSNKLGEASKEFTLAIEDGSDSAFADYFYAQAAISDGDRDTDGRIEAALRRAIKIDPSFAPSYDVLARLLATQHKDLEEAHLMELQAVAQDPAELNYRLNTAWILAEQHEPDRALQVLQAARSLAANEPQKQDLEARILQMKQMSASMQSSHTPATAVRVASSPSAGGAPPPGASEPEVSLQHVRILDNYHELKLPEPAKPGPHRKLNGTVHHVVCGYPKALAFDVESKEKKLSLFNADMYSMQLTTIGFIAKDEIDLCKQFEGERVQLEYLPVQDATYAGEVVAIAIVH